MVFHAYVFNHWSYDELGKIIDFDFILYFAWSKVDNRNQVAVPIAGVWYRPVSVFSVHRSQGIGFLTQDLSDSVNLRDFYAALIFFLVALFLWYDPIRGCFLPNVENIFSCLKIFSSIENNFFPISFSLESTHWLLHWRVKV